MASPGSTIARFDVSQFAKANPIGGLCGVCAALDSNLLFHHKLRLRNVEPANVDFLLGRWRHVKERSTYCNFCRLLTNPQIIWPRKGDDPNADQSDWGFHLSNAATLVLQYPGPDPPFEFGDLTQPSTRLAYAYLAPLDDSQSWLEKYSSASEDTLTYCDALRCSDKSLLHVVSDRNIFEGRQLGDHVSFEILKRWMKQCESKHQVCRQSYDPNTPKKRGIFKRLSTRTTQDRARPEFNPYFKLIDVHRRAIVRATSAARYLTLSYVWGRPNMDYRTVKSNATWKSNQDGQYIPLDRKLPATIEDAMTVVAKLGESYLWVDAICIVQDDLDEVPAQLADMAAVYGNAMCCITALSGSSADHGLPGIRHPRRNVPQQECTSLGDISIGLTLPRLDQIWDACPHPTRAWTYQEIQLSRRILFFSENEVFWNCVAGFERESVRENWSGLFGPAHFGAVNTIPSLLSKSSITKMKKYSLSNYVSSVERYTLRDMTFQTDGLNAFIGTGSLISSLLKARLYYGIPIELHDHALGSRIISLTLCWDIQRLALKYQEESKLQGVARLHQRRRHARTNENAKEQGKTCFPSWAWCSYTGSIEYPGFLATNHTASSCLMKLVTQKVMHEHALMSTFFLPNPGYLTDPTCPSLGYVSDIPAGVLCVTAPCLSVMLERPSGEAPRDLDFPGVLRHQGHDRPVGACHVLPEMEADSTLDSIQFAALVQVPESEDSMHIFTSMASAFCGMQLEAEGTQDCVIGLLVQGPSAPARDHELVYRVGMGMIPKQVWQKLTSSVELLFLA